MKKNLMEKNVYAYGKYFPKLIYLSMVIFVGRIFVW